MPDLLTHAQHGPQLPPDAHRSTGPCIPSEAQEEGWRGDQRSETGATRPTPVPGQTPDQMRLLAPRNPTSNLPHGISEAAWEFADGPLRSPWRAALPETAFLTDNSLSPLFPPLLIPFPLQWLFDIFWTGHCPIREQLRKATVTFKSARQNSGLGSCMEADRHT